MADIPTGGLRDAAAWVKGETTAPVSTAKRSPKATDHDGSPPSTGEDEDEDKSSDNPFVWFWEAIEGDFNDNRNTKQILVDAAISMIPLVDQVCDIRDLIANCRKIYKDPTDVWAWVSLVLTLIGLFPTLGSLVKGVLKIFFGFVRRAGGKQVGEAIEAGMTMVVTFLRRPEVQKYLKDNKVHNVFQWLAEGVKEVRGLVNVKALKGRFDEGIKVLEQLVSKVEYVPSMGAKAKQALELVKEVRLMADKHLANALKPIDDILGQVITRLEREALEKQGGVVDAANIHYRGTLPEAAAIPLMRSRKPSWLTAKVDLVFDQLKPADFADELALRSRYIVDESSGKKVFKQRPHKDVWPPLTDTNIRSFNTLAAKTIKGPAKLYRILAPNSKGMSDCWVSEEVFKRLESAPDPKAAWRKHLAVWPDWNGDGQFVIYDVKPGESLNVWRGLASSQTKNGLDGFQLEGGYEQIIFNVGRKDARADEMLYYKLKTNGKPGEKFLTQAQVDALNMNAAQRTAFYASHMSIRANINHPNISGPFETGWGYTDFDGRGLPGRIGLPNLPGQSTTSR